MRARAGASAGAGAGAGTLACAGTHAPLHVARARASRARVRARASFGGRFNIACDRAAARALLTAGDDGWDAWDGDAGDAPGAARAGAASERLTCPVRLVTTELCKDALALEPAELYDAVGHGPARELYVRTPLPRILRI